MDKGGAPAGTEVTPEPSAPRDATRAEKEEIVYLNLVDLHPVSYTHLFRQKGRKKHTNQSLMSR